MITIKMTFVKSTKNKHVFTDKSEAPVIEVMYINKSGMVEAPKTITVTIDD